MADYDQIMKALRNAHAAGDTAAANRLAAMARAAKQPQGQSSGAGASGDWSPSVAGDLAKSAGSGLLSGAASLADLPGVGMGLMSKGADILAEKAGASEPFRQSLRAGFEAMPTGTGDRFRDIADTATGGGASYQPKTTAGEYTKTAAEFVPGALVGGGGVKAALQYGVLPGLASEAAGQVTEGTSLEPYARAAAAIATPLAVAGAGRLVSPFGGVDPERLKLAKVLDDYGVPVTAGQRVGSDTLRRIEGGSIGAGGKMAAQNEAFTKSVLKTAGIHAERATPDVIDDGFKRIGQVFDDAVAGVDVVPDPTVLTKMSGALKTYRDLTPATNAPPIFGEINRRLLDAGISGKGIPANIVKSWRSTLSKLTTNADQATREAAIEALDAVDDAISSALVSAGKPEAVQAITKARGEYRNLLAISTAASRAGEDTALGILTPSNVRNAVVMQGRKSYVTGGRGDIGELSRAAEAVIKPLPTVSAGGVRAIENLAPIVGVGAGGLLGGVPGAIAGVAAPMAGRELVGSSPIQAYLANQLLNPSGVTARGMASTIPGLLAQ